MKTVEYSCSGKFICADCDMEIPAWRSSGMSGIFPHFYCSDCSNAIFRESDQRLVMDGIGPDTLKAIASSLPDCGCGGKFVPGADPKCPRCKYEFKNSHPPVSRLSDPNIFLVDGAVFYGDDGPNYKVRIIFQE